MLHSYLGDLSIIAAPPVLDVLKLNILCQFVEWLLEHCFSDQTNCNNMALSTVVSGANNKYILYHANQKDANIYSGTNTIFT